MARSEHSVQGNQVVFSSPSPRTPRAPLVSGCGQCAKGKQTGRAAGGREGLVGVAWAAGTGGAPGATGDLGPWYLTVIAGTAGAGLRGDEDGAIVVRVAAGRVGAADGQRIWA